MKIKKNKVVAISYELRLKDKNGEIVETVDHNKPFSFIFGTGNMLPKFEERLNDYVENQDFEFELSSADAYGEYDEERKDEIPLDAFMVDGKIDDGLLDIGNFIPLQDSEGNHFNGKVIEVTGDAVKMDFNHPLAGETLYFKGSVLSLREATKEELSHGHIHKHSHQHAEDACGCGSECGCN